MIPVLLLAGCMLVGATLLTLGLRGRRINDHPTCAACRFDLIGTPGAAACPECGGDLHQPGAVRQGARVRRPWLIATACALWLLSILAVGGFLAGEKLIPYHPTWLLLLEAERMSNTRTPAIVAELIARSDRNELGAAAKARLARRALLVQADPAINWEREWAAVLMDPGFAATLTQQERSAAAGAGALPELLYRHRLREGQKLPIELKLPISERFLQPGRSARGRGIHITVRDASGRALGGL